MLTSTSSAMATIRRRITSMVTGSSGSAMRLAFDTRVSSMAAVNVDLSQVSDPEAVARTNERARAVLDNQCRPLPREGRLQCVAVMDARVEEAILLEEEDRTACHVSRAGAAP